MAERNLPPDKRSPRASTRLRERADQSRTGTATATATAKRARSESVTETARRKPKLLEETRLLSEATWSTDEELDHMQQHGPIDILIRGSARTHTRQTSQAAGYDFYAARSATILPGAVAAISLGVELALPDGFYLQLKSRSSLALKNIHFVGGVIDSDYRDTIQALLLNLGPKPFTVRKGQRIVQEVICRTYSARFLEHDDLPASDRTGGFGSTGSH